MENVGYFVPEENPDNILVYFLSYPSRDSRKASWKGFVSDPDWKEAFAASKVNGKLVAKVESKFLTLTDYSPKLRIKKSKKLVCLNCGPTRLRKECSPIWITGLPTIR